MKYMKTKIFSILLALLIFLIPTKINSLSSDYKDHLSEILNVEKKEDVINIYFFYGDGCSHCENEEKQLKVIEKKYSNDIKIYSYETFNNHNNYLLMIDAKEKMNIEKTRGVPFLVIGSNKYLGYNDSVGERIENNILKYLGREVVENNDTEKIPILGKVNIKGVSILLLAVVLGFIDGFNPCAMWVLLFLINMLIGIKNRKKMLILGFAFLLVSGFVYFLSLLGISTFLNYLSAPIIRTLIGIFALVFGLYNLYKYFRDRKKEAGCDVIDEKKRKKLFSRIKKFTSEQNILLALIGVIVLAFSVNIVELACSTVFPATFLEIMAVNGIIGIEKIGYILIYVLFYMLDDFIIFIIAVLTLRMSAVSNKYNKYFKLISGVIMFLVGVLLIFKPEWVMLNFL